MPISRSLIGVYSHVLISASRALRFKRCGAARSRVKYGDFGIMFYEVLLTVDARYATAARPDTRGTLRARFGNAAVPHRVAADDYRE